MLQALEQGKAGQITWRVPDAAAIADVEWTMYNAAGQALATGTPPDPFQGSIDSQADQGEYRALVVDDDDATVDDTLRGRRIRCIMGFGTPIEAFVESTDVTANKLYVRLPSRAGDVVSVIDPLIAADLSATETANLGEGFRIAWTYSADGTDSEATTMFAVVRRVVPRLQWVDVLDRDPGMRLLTEGHDTADWRAFLIQAEELVDEQMSRHGSRILCIAERDQLIPLLLHGVRLAAADSGIMPSEYANSDPVGYRRSLEEAFFRKSKATLQAAYLVEPTVDNAPAHRIPRCLRGVR